MVPSIKEIRRIPKEEPRPLGKHGKKRGRSMRSRSKTVEVAEEDLIMNPEEGWDDDTKAEGVIVNYPDGGEASKRMYIIPDGIPCAHHDF